MWLPKLKKMALNMFSVCPQLCKPAGPGPLSGPGPGHGPGLLVPWSPRPSKNPPQKIIFQYDLKTCKSVFVSILLVSFIIQL